MAAAKVRFIIGRAGSGKTRVVYEAIAENERAGRRSLLIVPDRATFETEKELSVFLGGGMLFSSVLSFTRLAKRVLEDAGDSRAYLSKQGRMMLIRRILDESRDELAVFKRVGRRRGFAQECDAIIMNCKRFSLSPAELTAAEGLPEHLAEKLADFALVYGRLEERMAGRYIDGEDQINSMIALLPTSRAGNASVFIDAPDMLNEQSLRIIDALFKTASDVTVTLLLDPDGQSSDAELFRPGAASLRRLTELAKAAGCPVETVRLTEDHRRNDAALRALERNLFAFPYRKFPDDASNIELHASYSPDSETEEAAERILLALRSGLRCRDIAVAVSDLSSYAPILRRCFGRAGIPYFMDAKRSVADHPIAELISAALRCIEKNFRSEDFIRVLKTDLTGLDRDSAEKLENHILRFGLTGKRLYSEEPSVERTDDIPDFEALEASRLAVADPLLALKQSLSADPAHTAATRVRSLYGYLTALNVSERLREDCARLKQDPAMLGYALENQQIYDTIIALLDQIIVILGDEPIGIERFASVLEEGLASYEVGVIPTTLDQVLVSDVSSIHAPECELMLVLGANDGHIPRVRKDNLIINDRELSLMRSAGLNAWETTESMNARENLSLYSVLAKPRSGLYISYCSKIGSEAAVPSPIISRIGSVFPHCKRTTGISGQKHFSAEEAAFAELAVSLRRFLDTGEEPDGLAPLFAHYASEENYSSAVDMLSSMLFPELSSEPLGQDAALRLYGSRASGSPTRLETFNRCPFRYLLEFGLRLKERKLHQELSTDFGSLVHSALELLMRAYIEEKADFAALTKADITEKIDSVLPKIFEEHNGGIYTGSGIMRAQGERIREQLINIACVIVRQIADGSFRPYASELRFGGKDGELPALDLHSDGSTFRITGIVDRVDTIAFGDERFCRIIDYKTYNASFDFTALAAGLQLQLPLYSAAVASALSAGEKFRTAGFYYIHAKDLSSLTGDEEKDEKKLRTEMKLNGLTLRDDDVVTATDGTSFTTSMIVKGVRAGDDGYSGDGLVTDEEMAGTIAFAKAVGSKTLSAVMQGRAEISPSVSKGKTACDICSFRSVCRFDTTAGCKYRRVRAVTADQFFGRKDKKQ